MGSAELLGLPWWQWLVLAAVCVALAVVLRRRHAQARHLEAQEALARRADAAHEGAQTRHEGGA